MAEELDALTPEQRRLVEDHLDLVKLLAQQVVFKLKRHLDWSDLLQIGREGLLEAATTYNALAGWKFRTFAKGRVLGAMYNAYAREVAEEDRVKALTRKSGYEFLSTQARHGDVLTDMDGKADERLHDHCGGMAASMFAAAIGAVKPETPEQVAATHESFRRGRAALQRAVEKLPDRDARLLTLRYDEGWPLRDVGLELRIPDPGVYRQHDRIVRRLRAILAAAGVTELPPREDEL